ncbi:MAG: hypothetical protein AAFR31_09680 [Cyanobacteria bacterium J06627_8]
MLISAGIRQTLLTQQQQDVKSPIPSWESDNTKQAPERPLAVYNSAERGWGKCFVPI